MFFNSAREKKVYKKQAEPRGDLRESSQVNLIAATQGQMQQVLQLVEDGEAVGHQQGAVTEHRAKTA